MVVRCAKICPISEKSNVLLCAGTNSDGNLHREGKCAIHDAHLR